MASLTGMRNRLVLGVFIALLAAVSSVIPLLAGRSTVDMLVFAALYAIPPKDESETPTATTLHPLWRCPKCGGPMAVVERFTAAQLQLRSPPLLATAA